MSGFIRNLPIGKTPEGWLLELIFCRMQFKNFNNAQVRLCNFKCFESKYMLELGARMCDVMEA